MSDIRFVWLHLTYLHYGLDGQDCLWPNLSQIQNMQPRFRA
jgi:hypothetical protein